MPTCTHLELSAAQHCSSDAFRGTWRNTESLSICFFSKVPKMGKKGLMDTGLSNSVLGESRELQGAGSPAELAAGSGKERSTAKATGRMGFGRTKQSRGRSGAVHAA